MVLMVFLFHNSEENHWCRISWVASKSRSLRRGCLGMWTPRITRRLQGLRNWLRLKCKAPIYACGTRFVVCSANGAVPDRAAKRPGISVMPRPARTIRVKCGPVAYPVPQRASNSAVGAPEMISGAVRFTAMRGRTPPSIVRSMSRKPSTPSRSAIAHGQARDRIAVDQRKQALGRFDHAAECAAGRLVDFRVSRRAAP